MTRTIYRTATTFNGYIADQAHSLQWLFAVEHEQPDDHADFLDTVGVLVEGSSTYEWVLRETDLLRHPQQWPQYYGSRPTFVFTSRELPIPAGADVRFRRGAVADHLAELRQAAHDKDIWVVGGGDLAGQFLDADALDALVLTVAPAALEGGAPLLPRRVGADRLKLIGATRRGQFVQLDYAVTTRDRADLAERAGN